MEQKIIFGYNEATGRVTKIVRDNIPELMQNDAQQFEVIKLTPQEIIEGLASKLLEEAFELKEALDSDNPDKVIEEFADVQEVLKRILNFLKVNEYLVEHKRIDKLRANGGFKKLICISFEPKNSKQKSA